MAIIPKNDYVGRVDDTDPDFPQGKAINITGTTIGSGTPLESKWVNDTWGFHQAILDEAGITPNGLEERVGASDYLDGLKKLLKDKGSLVTLAEAVSDTSAKEGDTVIISDRGNGLFEYKAGQTANGYNIVACTGVPTLNLVLRANSFSNAIQFGGSISAGANLTDAIEAAINSDVKVLAIDNSFFSVTGTVDLQGMKLVGKATHGGEFINGERDGIYKTNQGPALKGGDVGSLSLSRDKVKLLIKEASLPNSDTSLNDEYYSIISPSSYGGISRFVLTNGIGAAASSADYGAPHDRLRPVQGFIYDNGWVLKKEQSSDSGDITDLVLDVWAKLMPDSTSGRYSSDGSPTIYPKTIPSGGASYIEYEVPRLTGNKANIAFYTTGGSSAAITLTVNGQDRPCPTPQAFNGSDVRIVSIDLDFGSSGNATIRLTNNDATKAAYVVGVNLMQIEEIESPKGAMEAGFFDACYLGGQLPMILEGSYGASIDTVIAQNGKFFGSFHGGDISGTCRIKLYSSGIKQVDIKTSTNPTPANVITVGEIWMAKSIIVSYDGTIQTTPQINTQIQFDFGVDGGCQIRCAYGCSSDTELETIFVGMHGTDPSLNLTFGKTFVGDDTDYVMPNNRVPYVQYSGTFQHLAVVPQIFDLFGSSRPQYVSDRAGNYKKYYYAPVENGSVIVDKDVPLTFTCTYMYGKNMV